VIAGAVPVYWNSTDDPPLKSIPKEKPQKIAARIDPATRINEKV
jgi:hypothetical protein